MTVAASVVVSAYNSGATLGRTLEALTSQELSAPYEVVVVDNGSDDDTGSVAAPFAPRVRVVRKDHGSVSSGRNRGVAEARGTALAFTDADCVPAPDWLREGLEALRGADIVQGAVRPDPGAAGGPFDRSVWVLAEVGLYETANLFMRRDAFDRIGGFEDWLVAGGRPFAEDVWLGWRAKRAGARIAFCEAAMVDHAVLPRGPAAYVRERWRLVHFPAMAVEVPELRRTLFFSRVFLSRRSAAFDAALAAIIAAGVTGFVPLLAIAIPYLLIVAGRALRWGRWAPLVAVVDLTADCVAFLALVVGSLRHRTLVL